LFCIAIRSLFCRFLRKTGQPLFLVPKKFLRRACIFLNQNLDFYLKFVKTIFSRLHTSNDFNYIHGNLSVRFSWLWPKPENVTNPDTLALAMSMLAEFSRVGRNVRIGHGICTILTYLLTKTILNPKTTNFFQFILYYYYYFFITEFGYPKNQRLPHFFFQEIFFAQIREIFSPEETCIFKKWLHHQESSSSQSKLLFLWPQKKYFWPKFQLLTKI